MCCVYLSYLVVLSVIRSVASSTLASHCFAPLSTVFTPSAALSSGCGAICRAANSGNERKEEEEKGVPAVASDRGEEGAEGGASDGGVDGDGGVDCDVVNGELVEVAPCGGECGCFCSDEPLIAGSRR